MPETDNIEVKMERRILTGSEEKILALDVSWISFQANLQNRLSLIGSVIIGPRPTKQSLW